MLIDGRGGSWWSLEEEDTGVLDEVSSIHWRRIIVIIGGGGS
jgi:hypothetical protein